MKQLAKTWVDEELHRQLVAAANEQERSLAWVIRQALMLYLAERGK